MALKKSPEVFGSIYEREKSFILETVKHRILPTETQFTLGAFDKKDVLMGMVLFVRNSYLKIQPRGSILGLYISTDSHGKRVAKYLLMELIEILRR